MFRTHVTYMCITDVFTLIDKPGHGKGRGRGSGGRGPPTAVRGYWRHAFERPSLDPHVQQPLVGCAPRASIPSKHGDFEVSELIGVLMNPNDGSPGWEPLDTDSAPPPQTASVTQSGPCKHFQSQNKSTTL